MQIPKSFSRLARAGLFSLVVFIGGPATMRADEAPAPTINVPRGINHDALSALLKKYVNEQGLVNYTAWKADPTDVAALNGYLRQFAPKADKPAEGDERAADLTNAYNAGVLSWILQNYPTESVWETKDPFKTKRYTIGGEPVSLDDIENVALRPQIGVEAHAVLVCAARSCPPLQQTAYSGGSFEREDAKAYHVWLGRPDLNKFEPEKKQAEISSIFKWFKADFDKAGGVKKVLAEKAPEKNHAFLAGGDYEIGYLSYNWGLNDQGEHGRSYSKADLVLDKIFH